MKRYRIVSNTDNIFRIQRRVRLGFARFWVFEKYYEVTDTYPKVIAHPVEFKTIDEAQKYIEAKMVKVVEHKKWRVVRAFSDNKPIT